VEKIKIKKKGAEAPFLNSSQKIRYWLDICLKEGYDKLFFEKRIKECYENLADAG